MSELVADLGDASPADPKGPPFALFWDIHFWITDPKIFLKLPLASIINNYEGEARAKKCNILVKMFEKGPEKLFPSKFWLRRKKFGQNGLVTALGKTRKINFANLKKNSTKFFENPPPRKS